MNYAKIFVFCAALLCAQWLTQPTAQADEATTKAAELIAQARAALGDLSKLKSLTITGDYRRKAGKMDMSGDLQLDILLPDKVMQTEVFSPMGGIDITRYQTLNGATTWTDTANSGGGHVMMINNASVKGGNLSQQAAQDLALKIDMTRTLLGLLLTVPASLPVEFSYAGVAESPDGKADVLEIKAANPALVSEMKMATITVGKLFLDQKTHQPWMISYQGRQRVAMVSSMTTGQMPTKEDLEKRAQEAAAAAEAAPIIEYQWRFSDFRNEGGLNLPHRFTKLAGEDIVDEWELKKFKLNSSLKPEQFEKKK
jgi:hypothetical protein